MPTEQVPSISVCPLLDLSSLPLSLGMRHFSWNKIKDAVYSLVLIKTYFSSNSHVQRLLSFGSSNETNEALPVSSPQTESPPPPSPGRHPLMVEAASNTTATAVQMAASSLPSAAEDKQSSRSIAELTVPAGLCVAIYGSIPPGIHLDHHGVSLYDPLVAFVCLGVFASLCIVVYALANPGGGPDVESTKQKVMGVSVGFLLIAFVLRILLLIPIPSLGLAGLLSFLGAATVVALYFFLPWKKEESHNLIAADPAPDYSLQNQV